MYIIMGGTGHVGSATAEALLARGEPVTVVARDARRAFGIRQKGAQVIEADLEDVAGLRAALRTGRRAFLLNPPADPRLDTDEVERHTVSKILAALVRSGLEKVVAASTGGARSGERLGDLNTLWELEEGLRGCSIPAAINRGAYYMSNWDPYIEPARRTGKLQTLFPPELPIPMVAPRDLGEIAAARLLSVVEDIGIEYVEGPARYTPANVAQILGDVLGRTVELQVIPRSQWEQTFRAQGFSPEAANSYARMTATSIDAEFDLPDQTIRGRTTLHDYLRTKVE